MSVNEATVEKGARRSFFFLFFHLILSFFFSVPVVPFVPFLLLLLLSPLDATYLFPPPSSFARAHLQTWVLLRIYGSEVKI